MRMKKQELNYITGSSNERGDLWSEDYPGVSKWMPVEYEYLKVYPAVNSESKISDYTEDGDLIRSMWLAPPTGLRRQYSQSSNLRIPRAKSSQATVNNSSGHLTNDDYAIICAWLSKHSNYSYCFGKPGSTTISGPLASKENGYNLMVNELNKKPKLTNNGMKRLRERAHPQSLALQKKIKARMDHIFGSLPNVNPLGGGEPKQQAWALTQTINESTYEHVMSFITYIQYNIIPYANPPPFAAPTPVNDEQLFRFTKEDADIREGEDMNQPALNSDIITNDIIVPPLATPIKSSTSRKTSNSWNLNPNSHQKSSKSALPLTTYAELYEEKTDRCISWEGEKWSFESELQLKQGEITKDLEYKKLEYAKEEKDKELVYGREEKEKEHIFKLFLAKKENEALKRKEDCDLLLADVGSLHSHSEISKIAAILNS
ncbi:hypothetical protein PPACK8108_LOCUS21164 [Phakopsora pachyrhizi]|uniref:Uncharacterized protein n=1 Tax=Phakopsora pachyrhizi TaxID=170000 RepID=A0AAV0BGS4_PHAPC|nr:hypothetical protein PPACK8108_LOCUS21164 [Phakopsora pachyrhizi]